jgi:hypothetical protein
MIVLPVLIVMIFGVVQMALCWHARNIVESTAEEASRIATAADGTCAQAESEGAALGLRLGGHFLDARPTVACLAGPVVVVTVQARALSILPGLDFPVSASAQASAPRER